MDVTFKGILIDAYLQATLGNNWNLRADFQNKMKLIAGFDNKSFDQKFRALAVVSTSDLYPFTSYNFGLGDDYRAIRQTLSKDDQARPSPLERLHKFFEKSFSKR